MESRANNHSNHNSDGDKEQRANSKLSGDRSALNASS